MDNKENLVSKFIEVNKVSLCYSELGESAIPLIFVHGFPFDKSCWDNQLLSLSANIRVIALDLRGFGESNSNGEQITMEVFAKDLISFMDALKIEKCIACGISMGGYILMNAATVFPERFHALILSNTQCIADSAEGKEKRYKTIEEINKNGLANFAEQFSKTVVCEKTVKEKPEVVQKIKNVIGNTSPDTVTRTLKALAERSETCTSIKKLSLPTLIICGKSDSVIPASQSEFLFNTISGAKLEVLEDAGHMTNLEQPEQYNKAILSFCMLCN